jgi:hypothetical protein
MTSEQNVAFSPNDISGTRNHGHLDCRMAMSRQSGNPIVITGNRGLVTKFCNTSFEMQMATQNFRWPSLILGSHG